MRMNVALALLLCVAATAVQERPVMKVVRMLEDMKAQIEKEKADDDESFAKMMCWCDSNNKEKSAAIALGESTIADLKSSLGEYAAKIEELREGIAQTRDQLAKNKNALDTATEMRMKENKAFHGEEKDLLAAIQSIQQAVVVLSKHNSASMAQLQSLSTNLAALQAMQLAKDALSHDKMDVLKAFIQQSEEGSKSLRSTNRDNPQGHQSYAPQSGQIFGILTQMKEEFEGDLSSLQSGESKAEEEYQSLKAAKEEELAAGKKQLDQLRSDDAEFREKQAQAYEQQMDTEAQLAIDNEFLANLKKQCALAEKDQAARTKGRLEELVAIEDTIGILNSDDSFDSFTKTVASASAASLLQTRAMKANAVLRRRAAQALLKTGIKELAVLAQTVQIDAFTKVKAAMDDMVAELKKQQAEEVEHRDWCTEEMNLNTRETTATYAKKDELDAKMKDLDNSIVDILTKSINEKTEAVKNMNAEMLTASEVRAYENNDFQQVAADQQVTQAILQKAVDRMKQVYADNKFAFEQQDAVPHIQTSGTHTDPGNGPARFGKYEKSSGGMKIVAMLEGVITDSKALEDEAHASENDSQAEYEMFMKDSNNAITQYDKAIANMSEERAKGEEELVMAKQDFEHTMKTLESLSNENQELHKSCDFVLKNFDSRQSARSAEMDALVEAKNILSGMN